MQSNFSTLVHQAVSAAMEGLSQQMAMWESAVDGHQEKNEETWKSSPAPLGHSGASGSSSKHRESPPPPDEDQQGTLRSPCREPWTSRVEPLQP